MPDFDYTIPDAASEETRAKIEEAISQLSELTIEDREYAFDRANLNVNGDARVNTAPGGAVYVVRGEKPLVADVAIAEDTEGGLAKGAGHIRVGVRFNGPVIQYRERDYGSEVYDIFESAGISRPENDPEVGVQIRPNKGLVVIENVVEA